MSRLYNKQSGALLGAVTDADVQCLIDVLEEEDTKDVDYFIDLSTVEILEANGASPGLAKLLRESIGTAEGIDVRWEK